MIPISELQKKLGEEGTLDHKLTLDEFRNWLVKRNTTAKTYNVSSVYNVILENKDILERIHLELEYGRFSHYSEMGCELYAHPNVLGVGGIRGPNFNKLCIRLQQSYVKSYLSRPGVSPLVNMSAEDLLMLYDKYTVKDIMNKYRVCETTVRWHIKRAQREANPTSA
ncbi:MAG: hypothetical protein AABW84_02205 [Nanoarchaeota archaeon]